MFPQLEVISKENTGYVDYVIILLEKLKYLYSIITIATEWYFLLYNSEKILFTFKNLIKITFSEIALTDSEKNSELYKSVKAVLKIIVSLLRYVEK